MPALWQTLICLSWKLSASLFTSSALQLYSRVLTRTGYILAAQDTPVDSA